MKSRPTLVIKIGGRLQNDPRLVPALASFIASRSERVCVVHGGGDQVTGLQQQLGREPQFVDGRRMTRPDEMADLRMVLSGSVNKDLVSRLITHGVSAVGLSGEDGPTFLAEVFGGGALGSVGSITSVRTELLYTLLESGYAPVISPVSRGIEDGQPLNVNADDVASALATEVRAREFLMLSEVAGVMGPSGLLTELRSAEVDHLISDGHITGGMIPKVRAAQAGVQAGIGHVRIANLDYLLGLSHGTLVGS